MTACAKMNTESERSCEQPDPVAEKFNVGSRHARVEALMPVGGRIIVIDDDGEMRSFLCEMLAVAGYSARAASGGVEGLQLIEEKPAPDAVILDLRMPEMSGEAVLAAIRAKHPELFVVVASAIMTPVKASEMLAQGASACLSKSDLAERLISVLQYGPQGSPQ